MDRCYPNNVDADTWAQNIADSVVKYLPGKGDIILIGHSMGGKSALHAVAKNIGGLADRTRLVVTINSPIKRLDLFQAAGGATLNDYCRAFVVKPDRGICTSVTTDDSSEDGLWVGKNRHWLAFISGESSPLSSDFNYGGPDPFPRDADDGVVPIAAQYADGADVVYYGERGHSDFNDDEELADYMAREILEYIFGGVIECSVFTQVGTFEHYSSGLWGTDNWEDITGDIPGLSGVIRHRNNSYTLWQRWEDVIEYEPPTYENSRRTRYEVSLSKSSGILTGIEELRWLETENPYDFRVYVRTKAAPLNALQLDWKVYRQGLLPQGMERDHYEVRTTAGTSLAGIENVSWASSDPRDIGLRISSWTERPYRWFQAEWKVFQKESRYREIINEFRVLPESTSAR
jgi:hypothetical protein